MPGNTTLDVEVTHVSRHGFWLLIGDEELLLPFDQFPWFRQATIDQISQVERPTAQHLYWPSLDIDLSIDAIRRPADFPLVSGVDRSPG
jgi:Protein of unknown function (DUF2442)